MTLSEIIQRANEALADGSLSRCLDVEPHYAAMLVDAAISAEAQRKQEAIAKRMRELLGNLREEVRCSIVVSLDKVEPDESGINAAEALEMAAAHDPLSGPREEILSGLEDILRRLGH